MNETSSMPGAAIHYTPDAYDTSRSSLRGRQSAGESFLKAFLRHAGSSTVHIYGDRLDHRNFSERFGTLVAAGAHVETIGPSQLGRLAEIGTLFIPDPGVSRAAWKRRFVGNRAYSVCGLIHTIASHAVMEAIEGFCVAPVQAWDALICTSEAGRKAVQTLVAESQHYLRSRTGVAP